MSDYVLLRFRDLTTRVNSIDEHNKITQVHKSVYWGWWKKPAELMPDPSLTVLQREVMGSPGTVPIFFIDSATEKVYQAVLHEVIYEQTGPELKAPNPDLCPEYYRTKTVPAWFRIGLIHDVDNCKLNEYVFSTANRTASNRGTTGLKRSEIGEVVKDTQFLDSNVSLWFIAPTHSVEFSERTQIVRPLSRGIWPVKGRYALHLSDLHFGVHHAFRNELGSAKEPRLGKETMAEALIEDMRLIDVKLEQVALLLVTGDLTWTGDAHEFANAASFLENLRNAFGLHLSQIVVIPGNHDIEWRDGKGDIDPNAELNYRQFCYQLYHSHAEESFLRVHQFMLDDRYLCIIGMNSCRIESKENAGYGFVGREQLTYLLKFLHENKRNQKQLNIALIHHHLLPVNHVEDFSSDDRRISLTLDSEAIMRNLIGARVPLVLHGHQHQPYISQVRRIVQNFVDPFGFQPGSHAGTEYCLDGTLSVVGAGSLGVSQSHINRIGRNSYNIIDIGDPAQVVVRTRVQSGSGPGFTDYQHVSLKLP
jgi:3',5'-cyclic AMP phosphodiesterase CpdA